MAKAKCGAELGIADEDHRVVLKCSLDPGHLGGHQAAGKACTYQSVPRTEAYSRWTIEWIDDAPKTVAARRAAELKKVSVPENAAKFLADIFNLNDPYELGLDGDDGESKTDNSIGPLTAEELLADSSSFEKLAEWCRFHCFIDTETDGEKHSDEMTRRALSSLEDYFRGQRL